MTTIIRKGSKLPKLHMLSERRELREIYKPIIKRNFIHEQD